jgi:hypothetical protein
MRKDFTALMLAGSLLGACSLYFTDEPVVVQPDADPEDDYRRRPDAGPGPQDAGPFADGPRADAGRSSMGHAPMRARSPMGHAPMRARSPMGHAPMRARSPMQGPRSTRAATSATAVDSRTPGSADGGVEKRAGVGVAGGLGQLTERCCWSSARAS